MDIEKIIKNDVDEVKNSFLSILPDNFFEYIVANSLDILFAIVIFFVGKFLAKKISSFTATILKRSNVEKTVVRFLENIIFYTLLVVVVLATLNKLGVQTTSFIAILGAASLAVALSLKDSLKNFASGVMIIIFKPFKVGDSVIASGVTGTVVEVNIFNTILLNADNQKVIIPNSSITNSNITNQSEAMIKKLEITLFISYKDDINKAKNLLEELAKSSKKLVESKSILVNVIDLSENGVQLSLVVWTFSSNFANLKSELLENIKSTFEKNGIEINPIRRYEKNI